MATTFDALSRYGLKEVADVTFYRLDNSGKPQEPVLVLDSLKVTSIEQTAEQTEARGGKGNPKLIVWDYGKEITLTIEDALFSPKSLSIMMGDGTTETTDSITRSGRIIADTTSTSASSFEIDGITVANTALTFYDAAGATTEQTALKDGTIYNVVWNQTVTSATTITVGPDSFPGTYYIVGDTRVRAEANQDDKYFQFIIPKAKVQPEQTLNMEAEGDPTTFNMTVQVLRPTNKEMIKFIQYDIGE